MMPPLLLALTGCLAVTADSDSILARDLIPAVPSFAALAPDTPIAFAPITGAQRIFRASELRRLMLRLRVELVPAKDVCVERKTEPLETGRVLEVMRRALPGARLEIIELSRQPVPSGDLRFSTADLKQTPDGGLWKGTVVYGGGRHFKVWARVRASVTETRVVAVAELNPGRLIEASQLRLETQEVFPRPGVFACSIEEVSGKLTRRPVAPGASLQREWLLAPKDVLRGDTVLVEAQAGAARLKLEGIAEASGGVGEVIPIRNPASNRRFNAVVLGRNKVSAGGSSL